MSQTSTLYNLTPNVQTKITVTAQANRIRVVNDSSLYLRVYFGADAPILATDPGWHDTISPGDKPLLWITGGTGQTWWAQSGNPSSTPFTGVITFLPFFPVGTTSVSGGVVTGASILYITAFSPDEIAERGGQTEAFVQAAKQGRLQSVDGAIPQPISANTIPVTTTTPNATDVLLIDQISRSRAPALYAANDAGASLINLYVYWMQFKLRSRGPNLAGVHALFSFRLTNSNLVGGASLTGLGVTVEVVLHAANFGVDTWVLASPKPVVLQGAVGQGALPAGGAFAWLRFNGIMTAATDPFPNYGQWDIIPTVYALIDYQNQSVLNALPHAIPPGEPAWNATYNPQTY